MSLGKDQVLLGGTILGIFLQPWFDVFKQGKFEGQVGVYGRVFEKYGCE